jgi:hypothetical protein
MEEIHCQSLRSNIPNNPTYPKKILINLINPRRTAGGFTFTHDVRTYGQRQFLHVHEEQLREYFFLFI